MEIKKITSAFLTFAIVLYASASAMAFDSFQSFEADSVQAAKVDAAKKIAYKNAETASPALRDEILEARKVIIFNETWIADGFEATVTEPDGTVYRVPHFSDLFPSDWNLPVSEPTSMNMGTVTRGDKGEGRKRVALNHPSATEMSPSFAVAPNYENVFNVHVDNLETSETCNIGFKNEDTGESVGVFTYKSVGFSVGIEPNPGTIATVSARASTYSTPGYGIFSYSYW